MLCDLLLECKVNVVYFDKEDSTRSFQTTLRGNFQEEQFQEDYKVLSGISLVEGGLPVLHLLTLSKRKPIKMSFFFRIWIYYTWPRLEPGVDGPLQQLLRWGHQQQ